MKIHLLVLASVASFSYVDSEPIARSCKPPPPPPATSKYPVSKENAAALLTADNDARAAAQAEANARVVHRDLAARNVLRNASVRYVQTKARAIAQGTESNEQVVRVLLTASVVLDRQFAADAVTARDLGFADYSRALVAQRAAIAAEANALAAVFEQTDLHTAAHEAAHVVQQRTAVSGRTRVTPVRAVGAVGRIDVTCDVDTTVTVVDVATAQAIENPLYSQGGHTVENPMHKGFVVTTQGTTGEQGTCTIRATSALDLRSVSAPLRADTAPDFAALHDDNLDFASFLAKSYPALGLVPLLSDAAFNELETAFADGRAVPLEDVRSSTLANAEWVSYILADLAAWSDEPALVDRVLKTRHETAKNSISNIR